MNLLKSFTLVQVMDTLSNIRANATIDDFKRVYGVHGSHIWSKFVGYNHDFFMTYQVLDTCHKVRSERMFEIFQRLEYSTTIGTETYYHLVKYHSDICNYLNSDMLQIEGKEVYTVTGSYEHIKMAANCLEKIQADCEAIKDYAEIQKRYYLLDKEHKVSRMLREFEAYPIGIQRKSVDNKTLGEFVE